MSNTIQIRDDQGNALYPITDASLIIGLENRTGMRVVPVDSLPTASADTVGVIYMVTSTQAISITKLVNGSYSWVSCGTLDDIDLSGYATKEELDQLSQEVSDELYGRSIKLIETVQDHYLDSTGAEVSYQNYTILRYSISGLVSGINVKFTAGPVAYTLFYDEGGNILSSIPGAGAIDTVFTVPSGAKTVAFSFSSAYQYEISIDNPKEGLSTKVDELDAVAGQLDPVETVPTLGGTSWRLLQQDGTVVAANSNAWYVSDLLRINKGQILEVTVDDTPAPPYVTVQLLYDDGTIVNYIGYDDIVSGVKKTINIDKNGYARFGYHGSGGLGYTAKIKDTIRNITLNNEAAAANEIDRNVRFVGMSIWYYDGRQLADGFMGGVTAQGYQTNLRKIFKFRSDSGTTFCYDGGSLGAKSLSDGYSIMYHSSGWTSLADAIWTLDTITNDFKRDISIGTVTDYENATGILTYYGALRAFRDKVVSLSGASAIVICANALHRNNSGYTSTSQNANGDTLADFERALMTVAAKNGWYFVDQFRLSAIQDNSIDITTIDGLHLNNFGYTLAVKPWIEQFKIIAGY